MWTHAVGMQLQRGQTILFDNELMQHGRWVPFLFCVCVCVCICHKNGYVNMQGVSTAYAFLYVCRLGFSGDRKLVVALFDEHGGSSDGHYV